MIKSHLAQLAHSTRLYATVRGRTGPKQPAATSKAKSNSTAFETTVRDNMAKYPDAILLTQVGTFFEVSFCLN